MFNSFVKKLFDKFLCIKTPITSHYFSKVLAGTGLVSYRLGETLGGGGGGRGGGGGGG